MKRKTIGLFVLLPFIGVTLTSCGVEIESEEETSTIVEEETTSSSTNIVSTEEAPTIDYDMSEPADILVNQVGFLTNGNKEAVFRGPRPATDYVIKDYTTNKVVYKGRTKHNTLHYGTKEYTCVVDFSDFTTPGKYYIEADTYTKSYSFEIKEDVYDDLFDATIHMLYLQRCGCKVEDTTFSHEACHTNNAIVYGTNNYIDVSGGWHDAGDYGKYVVAGVKTIEDLFISYENTGYTPLLDEAKYELDWMLKMQNDKGEVYHKVTTYSFPGMILPQKDYGQLVVSPVSYAATADFSAIMARAASIYKSYNATQASKYKDAAKKAYTALANMEQKSFYNPSSISTGEYSDSSLNDELEYASMALYDLTKEESYRKTFEALFNSKDKCNYGWASMTGYAYRLYVKDQNASKYLSVVGAMETTASQAKQNMDMCPYSDSINGKHTWGSNMKNCNNGMAILDYSEAKNKDNSEYIQRLLDYLLGMNITGYSYVTGFGEKSPINPHHRQSIKLKSPMPGMLVGGPNNDFTNNGDDTIATNNLSNAYPEAAYIDHNNSWSTNEIAIYWNSPLIVLLSTIVTK